MIVATQADSIPTIVIVHDVRPEHRSDYEQRLSRALLLHEKSPGHLPTQIIRPLDASHRYVVILRFATSTDAQAWTVSYDRGALLQGIKPWLIPAEPARAGANDDGFGRARSERAEPKRWKQWLLSFMAVFPLASSVPWALSRALDTFSLPVSGIVLALSSAAIISGLMVYGLMPWLGKCAGTWLYR